MSRRFLHKTTFQGGFEMASFLSRSDSNRLISKLFRRSHLVAVQIPPHYLPQKVEIGMLLKT